MIELALHNSDWFRDSSPNEDLIIISHIMIDLKQPQLCLA